MRISKPITTLIFLPLLTACLAQTSDTEPKIDAKETASQSKPRKTISPAIAAAARAQDLSTKALLRELHKVFETAPSVQALVTRINALDTRRAALGELMQPEVSVSGTSYGSGLIAQATQPLFDFGKKEARLAQLAAERGSMKVSLATAQNTLLSDALTAGMAYNFARARADLLDRKIADNRRALDSAQRLFELNLVSKADVNLADVEVKMAQIDLARARKNAAEHRSVWSRVFGQSSPPRIDIVAIRSATRVDTSQKAYRTAKEKNLNIRTSHMQQDRFLADELALQKRNTPTINLSLQNSLGSGSDQFNAGLSLNYSIYNRENTDELVQTASNIEATKRDKASIIHDLRFDIGRLSDLAQASENLAAEQRKSLGLLKERVSDVNYQVEQGLSAYTDLIKARAEVFEAELDVLNNLYDAQRSHAQILLLSGALIP